MKVNKLKEHIITLNEQFTDEMIQISNDDKKSNYVKIKELINAQQKLLYQTNKHIHKTIKEL